MANLNEEAISRSQSRPEPVVQPGVCASSDPVDTLQGSHTDSNKTEQPTVESPTTSESQDASPCQATTNKSRRLAKRAEKEKEAIIISSDHAGASAKAGSEPKAKQRPALDVMNRLRWDTASGFDTCDVLIGYEDRHSERGIIEIPFREWEREVTAEEFVPLHRIRYFRRASDGAMLWHRRLRVDMVFGAGDDEGEGGGGQGRESALAEL